MAHQVSFETKSMPAVLLALALFAAVVLLLLPQLATSLGRARGVFAGMFALALLSGGWWWLDREALPLAAPANWSDVEHVTSETCAKCHPAHYESWHRTYHRSMTREAKPENIKGDFNN